MTAAISRRHSGQRERRRGAAGRAIAVSQIVLACGSGGQTNKVRQALRREDVRRRVAEAEAVLREHGNGTAGQKEPKK